MSQLRKIRAEYKRMVRDGLRPDYDIDRASQDAAKFIRRKYGSLPWGDEEGYCLYELGLDTRANRGPSDRDQPFDARRTPVIRRPTRR